MQLCAGTVSSNVAAPEESMQPSHIEEARLGIGLSILQLLNAFDI